MVLSNPVKGDFPISRGLQYDAQGNITHDGVDIATPIGIEALAMADGIVTYEGFAGIDASGQYDNAIVCIIDYGEGFVSMHGHLSNTIVSKGNRVTRGQVIGHTGNTGRYTTGPHCHLRLRVNGAPKDYRNYMGAIGSIGPQVAQLPANFSEIAYLELNPDVKTAVVDKHLFPSGANHYLRFGYKENRKYTMEDLEASKAVVTPNIDTVQQKETTNMPEEQVSLEQLKLVESDRDSWKKKSEELALEKDQLNSKFSAYKDSVLEKLNSFEDKYLRLTTKYNDLTKKYQTLESQHKLETEQLNIRISKLEEERDYYKAELDVWKGKAQSNVLNLKDLPHGKLFDFVSKYGKLAIHQPINVVSIIILEAIAGVLMHYNVVNLDPNQVFTFFTGLGGFSIIREALKSPFRTMEDKNNIVIDQAKSINPDFDINGEETNISNVQVLQTM